MMEDRFLKRLRKKARKGLRGWPIATIAFYGPNLHQATKTAVGIVPSENGEVEELRAWIVDRGDVRGDSGIAREILEFIEEHQVRSIAIRTSKESITRASGVRFASFGTDAIGLQDNGCIKFCGRTTTAPLTGRQRSLSRPDPAAAHPG